MEDRVAIKVRQEQSSGLPKLGARSARRPSLPGMAAGALLATTALSPLPAAAWTSCESLSGLQLPNTTITTAQPVAGGTFTPPGNGATPISGLPGFCRVAGVAKPTSDSNIQFEVWIPQEGSWNGKYEQVGNGGFAGTIPYSALAAALQRGYATAGTDDGHTGSGIDA